MVAVPFVWREHEIPYDCARYTSFGIQTILERHGFEIVELRKSSIGIAAIVQIVLLYLEDTIWKISFHNRYFAWFFHCTLFPVVILLTEILVKVFPYGRDLYLENIILAKKKQHVSEKKGA